MSTAPTSNTSEKSQLWEDTLQADLEAYREGSSQNPMAIEMIGAFATHFGGYAYDVVQSYSLLKKPLDPEKLVRDPTYRQKVEHAMKLVRRHEGGKRVEQGKSKYSAILKNTDEAVKQVRGIHQQQVQTKIATVVTSVPHLQSAYSLDEKGLQSVVASAQKRLKENPLASYHELLNEEAQEAVKTKIANDVKRDKTIERNQRNTEVQRRLKAQSEQFSQASTSASTYERNRCESLLQNRTRSVATVLGIAPDATAAKSAQVAAATAFSPNPPAQPPAAQPPTTHIPAPPSAPKFSFLPSGIGNLFSNVSNRIKSFTNRISSFMNNLGPAGSFLTGGLGGLAKNALGGLGSKLGGSTALKALGTQLASWLGGPVGKALLLANDILKSLIGVDVVGFSVKVVVIAIVGVVVILPMLFAFGGGLFSSGETVSVLSQSGVAQPVIGWKTFEEDFLVADSWEEFEEHQLLSINQLIN